MANSILKLKVETSEYDQKLANAAKGIRHLADVAHKGAGELTGLEKSEVDYIKALGDMETKSRSASGQVRELSSTYKELKVIYDQLNEVEKADEGGKALAASLETLKQRAQEAKKQLDSATLSLQSNGEAGKGTSGIMEMLKDKFTVNIDAIKLFNIGLQAAEGALSVAKDAFFASEATVDEWGRTVAASQSLYEGFLTAINNGDISGYLTRIDQIVQAAREAYNELDKLGTMRTIQGPQFSKQEAENTRMRMMVMTGRYIAPAAGSGMKATMAEGTVLTPEQIRRIEQKLESGMKSIGALTKNELAQTGKAIDAYYNKLAVTNGMSRSEFRQGTSSWDEFSRRMQGYEEYKRWDAQARAEFARQGGRGYVDFDKSNPYAEYRKWGTFRVDKMGENSYNDLVGLIKQQQQQTNQLYSQMGQTYRSINRAEGVTVRQIMGGSGGGGTTTSTTATPKTEEQQNADRIAELVKQYQDLATAAKTADDVQKAGITERMSKIQGEIKTLEARNAELKKFADEARQVQFPVGSLPQLNEQLKTLQTEQAKALDAKQWQNYQQQIEQTQYQIDALKGKWQEGLEATFKLEDVDVMEEFRDIESVTIDPKTLTVTANTADAYNQVQQLLQGVDGKTVTFTVLPQMEMGTSIQNDAGMSAYIASIKQQLETADYGTSLYNGLSAQLADMTTLQNLVGESLKAGLGTAMFDAADELGMDFWTRAMEGGVENIEWQTIVDKINEARKAAGLDAISLDFASGSVSAKDGKEKDVMQGTKTMLSAISQLTNGLQSIGVKIPSEIQSVISVMQGVMQVIEAVNAIIGVTQTTALTANTIAMGALTSALWANTATSWIPFANGGIVPKFADGGIVGRAAGGLLIPGNSMSGDRLRLPVDGGRGMIGVNSGELILNRSQQDNIASQLEGGGLGNMQLEARVSAEDLIFVLNNNGLRRGYGKFIKD